MKSEEVLRGSVHFESVGFADTLLIHYYLLLITYAEGSAGTPGGTRTPDLLLRRIGLGVFLTLKRPFGAVR